MGRWDVKDNRRNSEQSRRSSSNSLRNATGSAKRRPFDENAAGIQKIALILSIIAAVCFFIGFWGSFSSFPFSLASIVSGILFVYMILKRDYVETRFPSSVSVFLIILLSDYGDMGEAYTFLELGTCAFTFLALMLTIDSLGFLKFEDDDTLLASRCAMIVSLFNAVASICTLITVLSSGFVFDRFFFLLGSFVLWSAMALFYIYAKKPRLRTLQEIYKDKKDHPYHYIGGSVLRFIIGCYIVGAVFLIAALYWWRHSKNLIGMSAVYAGMNFGLLVLGQIIFVCAMLAICGLFMLLVGRKMRLRSRLAVKYYEIACLVAIGVSVGCIFYEGVRLIGIILFPIFTAASFFTLKWIFTSDRLRTYMGSDAYRKPAWLARRFRTPYPCDETGNGMHAEDDWEEVDPYDEFEEAVPPVQKRSSRADAVRANSPRSSARPAQQRRVSRFDPDRCCLCGGRLTRGYAILLKTESGEEARLDERCCDAIDILCKSEDERLIREAITFVGRNIGYADPLVAQRFDKYVRTAKDYLNGF